MSDHSIWEKTKDIDVSWGELDILTLLKNSVEIKKNVICSFDKKDYVVAGFDNIKNAEETYLLLKKSKYSVIFNKNKTFYLNDKSNLTKDANIKKLLFKLKKNLFYIWCHLVMVFLSVSGFFPTQCHPIYFYIFCE